MNAAKQVAAPLAEGTRLENRFEIVRSLGSGGMGTTYVARDLERGDECVVKELVLGGGLPANRGVDGARDGLDAWKLVDLHEREARVLARLAHPALPQLRAHFRVEEPGCVRLVLAEDLVPGESLATLIKQGHRFTEPEAIALLERLARILVHLHDELDPAVIHRDIKPSNIIIDAQGGPHLVDFGAVREEVLHEQRRAGETVVGSWGYVPPEQLAGQASPRSDLYALGATLVAALSHKEPSVMVTDDARLDFEPHVAVSPGLATILRKLVERRPASRYPSARALLADLERLRAGLPPPAPRPAFRLESRHIRLLLLALPLLLLLGTFADRFMDLRARSFSTGGSIDALAFSPESDRLAAAVKGRNLVVRDTASWDRTWERRLPWRAADLAYTPDGRHLAVLATGYDEEDARLTSARVLLLDALTGTTRHTLHLAAPRADSLAISRDGRTLAAATNHWDDREKTELDGEVRVFTLDEEPEVRAVVRVDRQPYFNVGFEPASGELLYVTRPWNAERTYFESARLVARDMMSDRERVVYTAAYAAPPGYVYAPDGHALATSTLATEEAVIEADGRRVAIGEPPFEYSYRAFVPGAFSRDGTRFFFPVSYETSFPWNWLPGANGQAQQLRYLGVYDAKSGRLLGRWRVRTGVRTLPLMALVPSPDGRFLAGGFGNLYSGGIKVWSLD